MAQYIHEIPGWTDMKYDESAVQNALVQFYNIQGKLFGKLDAFGFDVQNDLLLNSLSDEVVTSFEIEGEKLDKTSVRSSVAKKLGLDTAGIVGVKHDHYTEDIIEMTVDATQRYSDPVTDERIFGWHCAIFPTGRSGIRNIAIGSYRLNEMSVVSGAIGRETIHYKAPSPDRVPDEMTKFIHWLENDNKNDPYIKSAIAHLWFESIHPFDDGNGRIGRAISDLLLARAEESSKRFYSLSSQILAERNDYYNELEHAQKSTGSPERWITWFLGCLTRAVYASDIKLEKIKHKAVFFENIRTASLNQRQIIMLNKIIDGFEGKITTSKWAKINKCSHDTALRDIEDLIIKKIMHRLPEGGRSTSYDLNENLLKST